MTLHIIVCVVPSSSNFLHGLNDPHRGERANHPLPPSEVIGSMINMLLFFSKGLLCTVAMISLLSQSFLISNQSDNW